MPETDLYAPVKAFLEGQGYAVKGEVRECDIVALRGDEPPLIVELKATFSLQLVFQGIDRQAMSDAVYLAIRPPKRRQQSEIVRLCRRLCLGLLIVTGNHVEAVADPVAYQPRKDARRRSLLLKEFAHRVGDPNLGGSARAPRMTAYRQDALRCLAHLASAETGAAKVATVRATTGVARAATILRADVYGWFQKQERGIYAVTPKGRAALVTYATTILVLTPPAEAAGQAAIAVPESAKPGTKKPRKKRQPLPA